MSLNIRSIEFPVPETERTMIEVRGPKMQVERFILLCKTIEYLCRVGSSRTVSIDVDGDGAGRIVFTIDPRFDSIKVDDKATSRDPVRVPGINDYL
jgi:hypothetical protein